MRVGFHLNDERIILELDPHARLLDVLRDELGIRSVQPGCGKGTCGSCLVLLDSQAVPSCLVPVFSVRDRNVETIESLSTNPGFADIEKSFLMGKFSPCAFCAPSKVILAESLLRSDQVLDQRQIMACIPEHWCNCTSRDEFARAVLHAQESRQRRKGQQRG